VDLHPIRRGETSLTPMPAGKLEPQKKSTTIQTLPVAADLPNLFVGTSGWAYPTWKPDFYPEGVSARKFLGYYASLLNSVEVNYTFRKLPPAARLTEWLAQVGPGFRFSFKAPQRITHFSRLRDCDEHVAEFFRFVAPAAAAGKLGLVLFQLPPNFKADLPRLRTFLAAPAFRVAGAPPIAFEFRHESWFSPEAEALLREHDAALCIAETEDFVSPEIHSAVGHSCFRLRRSGGYKPREITAFATRLLALTKDRDVYVYFKHEDESTGALNASAFLRSAVTRARKAGR
jgi:uncharacterized protein YecE (DUF72 family)